MTDSRMSAITHLKQSINFNFSSVFKVIRIFLTQDRLTQGRSFLALFWPEVVLPLVKGGWRNNRDRINFYLS